MVLRVDHAFDSLKAINAYKGEQAPNTPHTNHKNSNFNKRTSSIMLVKVTSTQFNSRTPYNTWSNSTSTKLYNNYLNNNYSKSNYTNSGSTQKNYSHGNYNKDDKMKDAKGPSPSSKFPSSQSHPSNDKAGNPICYKCGKIGFRRDCPRHPYKP